MQDQGGQYLITQGARTGVTITKSNDIDRWQSPVTAWSYAPPDSSFGRAAGVAKAGLFQWPNGAYTSVGEQRLADLQRPATREFYDKFAQYDPKPAFTEQPGTPGEKLPFTTDALPDFSELPKPDADMDDSAATDSPPADPPAPAADAPPATEKDDSAAAPTDTPAPKEPAGDESAETEP